MSVPDQTSAPVMTDAPIDDSATTDNTSTTDSQGQFTSDNPADNTYPLSLHSFGNCKGIFPDLDQHGGWLPANQDSENTSLAAVISDDRHVGLLHFTRAISTDEPGTLIGDTARNQAAVNGLPLEVVSTDPQVAAVAWASVFARDLDSIDSNLVADPASYTDYGNGWGGIYVSSGDIAGYVMGQVLAGDGFSYAYILREHAVLISGESTPEELNEYLRMALSIQCAHPMIADTGSYDPADGVADGSTESDDGYNWVLGSEFLPDPDHPDEYIYATIDQEVDNACNTGVSGVEVNSVNGCSVATFGG